METFRTAPTLMTERLDVSYYRPAYIENQRRLDAHNTEQFSQFYKRSGIGHTASVEPHYSRSVKGIPFVSGKAIKDGRILIEEAEEILPESHWSLMEKSKLKPGYLLIVRKGNVGNSCVVPESSVELNCSSEIMFFECKDKKASHYLTAFFGSINGELAIKRLQRGSLIPGVSLYDIPELGIFCPHQKVQTYIGDKVRQAEQLRERAKKLEFETEEKMQLCFYGQPKPPQNKHSTVLVERLTSNRLESEFYTPLVLWAEEKIKGSQWTYKPLAELAYRIKDGPGGWGVSINDYVDFGIPVIRAINLINGECSLTDCVFISYKKHEELKSHKVKQGSVVLSVRGTIGRAAVFSSGEYEEANLNAAVVTIDCKSEILPHFLVEFLNTEVGRIQSQRIANGAVQLNMNLKETGSNLIVVPPKPFQEQISSLRQTRLLVRESARNLTATAKLLVEALIEGKVTEDELKAAQEGLERGDRDLDREILGRLTRRGMDVAGEPPLFPNLDALYTAIDHIEESAEDERLSVETSVIPPTVANVSIPCAAELGEMYTSS